MSGCCQNGTCEKCKELLDILQGNVEGPTCAECLRFEIYSTNIDRGYCRKSDGSLKLNEFGKCRVFGSKSAACGDYKTWTNYYK